MKKYIFKIRPSMIDRNITEKVDEVQQKIINQEIEEMKIVIAALDMREAKAKAQNELLTIIETNYGNVPLIGSYMFGLKLIEIHLV